MVKNDEGIKGGKFTGSAPSPGATVTMEVPMKGLQGELVMATIRLPRRLVAGAAGRPILLTITPKAGGGRQAVLLTPNHRRSKGEDKDPGKGDSKAALLREDRETPKEKETKSCTLLFSTHGVPVTVCHFAVRSVANQYIMHCSCGSFKLNKLVDLLFSKYFYIT